MQRRGHLAVLLCALAASRVLCAALECNPEDIQRTADPDDQRAYFHCSLKGTRVRSLCPFGAAFDDESAGCERQSSHGDVDDNESSDAADDKKTISDDPDTGRRRQVVNSVCGVNSTPWLLNGQAAICNPSVAGSCPNGYTCRLYATTGNYYCCSGTGTTTFGCPQGYVPYREPNSNQLRYCTTGSVNSCPSGYQCLSSNNVQFVCCGIDYGCPGTSSAYVPSLGGRPTQCTGIGQQSTCPFGYTCQSTTRGYGLICCSTTGGGTNVGRCPSGESPLSSGVQMVVCSSFQPCPASYTCTANVNGFQSGCCRASVCQAGEPLRNPSGAMQTCYAGLPCPNNYQCSPSGTTSYCCPTTNFACNQPLSSGYQCTTATQQTKWYYNPSTRQCTLFSYYGCGGNANRFSTQQACTQFCAGSGTGSQCPANMVPYGGVGQTACTLNVPNTCPSPSVCVTGTSGLALCCQYSGGGQVTCPIAGQQVYYVPGTSQPMYCGVGQAACPAGYQCMQAANIGRAVCCGQGTATQCPLGQNPYYVPGSSQAQVCYFSGVNTCPSGYQCYSSGGAIGAGICCGGASTQQCPGGLASSTVAQSCTLGSTFNQCGFGYACLQPVVVVAGNRGVCCAVNNLRCASGTTYLSAQQLPTVCGAAAGPAVRGCPTGYTCAQSTVAQLTLCCAQTVALDRCPNNLPPYYVPGTQTAQVCNLGFPTNCPVGYTCTIGTAGRYVCCQGTSGTTGTCANGVAPYYIPGTVTPQTCNLFQSNCPVGYRCQASNVAGTYYCCSSGGTNPQSAQCPSNTSPYTMAGRPLACPSPQSTQCPAGYSCTSSTVAGTYLCCSGGGTAQLRCYGGGTPFVPFGSTQPQRCTPGVNNFCPAGYACRQSTNTAIYICCGAFARRAGARTANDRSA